MNTGLANRLLSDGHDVGRRIRRGLLWLFASLVFVFLTVPILVVIPLSFNAEPYFSFPIFRYSLRWYEAFFQSDEWLNALRNSLIVASFTAVLATLLGTVAAIGLNQAKVRFKRTIVAFLISPMIVPTIITAVGLYFFLARLGLINTKLGLIFAHTLVATPFVVVALTATLAGFDANLVRAAQSLGAGPIRTFFKVVAPIILPGLLFGAILAFVTSLDEAVIVLFVAGPEQITLPRMMWKGLREQLNPTLLAVAAMLTLLSVLTLLAVELLRRRGERLRGVREQSPS